MGTILTIAVCTLSYAALSIKPNTENEDKNKEEGIL